MSSRFLIEVPHEENTMDCARAVEVFLKTGSHFLSQADWGCKDGDHRAWIIVEVDSKREALGVVPPAFRDRARIVQLNAFALDEIQGIIRDHQR